MSQTGYTETGLAVLPSAPPQPGNHTRHDSCLQPEPSRRRAVTVHPARAGRSRAVHDLHRLLDVILERQNHMHAQLHDIKQGLTAMSETLSAQIDAATAAIQQDLADMTSAVSAVGAEVSGLIAQLGSGVPPVGSTITQAQVDALTAVASGLATQAANLRTISTQAKPPSA